MADTKVLIQAILNQLQQKPEQEEQVLVPLAMVLAKLITTDETPPAEEPAETEGEEGLEVENEVSEEGVEVKVDSPCTCCGSSNTISVVQSVVIPSPCTHVKALSLDEGLVAGYAVVFRDQPDLTPYRDYFTKDTDFWLDRWSVRPMIYDHGTDPKTHDNPVVGMWTKAVVDEVGVWLEGQLDTAHKYYTAIRELIEKGFLKQSSDSSPNLIQREWDEEKKANRVKRWPLVASSLTVKPAEPLTSLELTGAYKSVGLDVPPELALLAEIESLELSLQKEP